MLLLKVDRASERPAFRQICERIVALVDEGALRPGDRLPPTRVLGASIGIHRSTVIRAYDELRALGYLESRAGSYTTIRRRERPPTTRRASRVAERVSPIRWSAVARPSSRALHAHAAMETIKATPPRDVIDLDRLSADPTLAPDDDLRRCLKSVLVRTKAAALDYADAAGWRPLREVIAARMCSHGVAVSPDEILITAGAQHALDLLLRYLTSAGDRVVVEAPTYGMTHALLMLHEIEAIEVPILDDGMNLNRLARVLKRGRRPKIVYTMPNFQYPTGITTDQQHRERLLLLCEELRIPLVQAAAARFCSGGEFDAYLRRIHRVYRRRMQALLRGLEAHMPDNVIWTRPSGGYTAWLTLPETGRSESNVVATIAAAGVKVGPGCRYYARPPAAPHVRLSISCVDEKRIEIGCRRLGRALAGVLS